MRAYSDIELVNLATGERWRRVTGDGESRLEKVVGTELDDRVTRILEEARKAVKPIVDRERDAEKNIGDLLNMRLD